MANLSRVGAVLQQIPDTFFIHRFAAFPSLLNRLFRIHPGCDLGVRIFSCLVHFEGATNYDRNTAVDVQTGRAITGCSLRQSDQFVANRRDAAVEFTFLDSALFGAFRFGTEILGVEGVEYVSNCSIMAL